MRFGDDNFVNPTLPVARNVTFQNSLTLFSLKALSWIRFWIVLSVKGGRELLGKHKVSVGATLVFFVFLTTSRLQVERVCSQATFFMSLVAIAVSQSKRFAIVLRYIEWLHLIYLSPRVFAGGEGRGGGGCTPRLCLMCHATVDSVDEILFLDTREILLCLDKLQTFKFEDEDNYENESLKVSPRRLKTLYPWKASWHYFHQKG